VILIGIVGVLGFVWSLAGSLVTAPPPGGHVLRLLAGIGVLALVVMAVRGSRAIHGSGAVLDDLVEQAARVEAGDYRARVADASARGPVRHLVRGFNTMAARLEADEGQRRSLLADVTHELRTPLTVIAGNVEAILDGVHPADEVHLTAILEETRVLERLVEDLRTLALSEAGSLSLHREPTDLDVLAADVVTSFAPAAAERGVAIDAVADRDVPLVDVDPVRIREVVGNLVANAVRHTPAGGRVEVAVRRRSYPAAASTQARGGRPAAAVEIVVSDTGPGIDPELLPHVFERFARGPASPGTGLGLSIARGLVELHGGTIEAASPPRAGTTMTVRLPVAPPT